MFQPLRFLAAGFFVCAALLFAAPASAQVPAVMYHAHENLGYVEADFIDHMDLLVENGFNTITMDQFYDWYTDDAALPLRPIIITVDDNYIKIYTEMYPILAARGMVGINYVHTLGIGIGQPKASWAQIIEMEEAGVFFSESHSQTHPYLSTVSASQLTNEIFGSRDDFAANMNGKVTHHLAYPYGDYNEAVINDLIAAGYRTGLTTLRGLNYRDTPIYELRRWWGDGKDLEQFKTEMQFSTYPPLPEEGWIIDDADPGFYYEASEWSVSSAMPGYYGSGYRYNDPDGGTGPTVRYAAMLPETGMMRVLARWAPANNRTTEATYIIRTTTGDVGVTVDQQAGGDWVELGVFDFAEDEPVEVLLVGGSDGLLIADALWFVPAQEPSGSDVWILMQ